MYIQSPPLGSTGLLPDLPKQVLPVGAWTDANNVRFNDGYISRIKEPSLALATTDPGKWLQLYDDETGPRTVYGSEGKLYRLNVAGDAWEDVTNSTIGTYSSGNWQSFQYGTGVVFNNGVDPPQILFSGAAEFVTIPNWGVTTSGAKVVTCKSLRLFGVYMVAMNLTIDGVQSPNGVWTSDPALIDNVTTPDEMPSWDYESPATRSTLNYIGIEYGPIIDGLELNNNFMIYTRESGHIFQLVGGQFVFANRKSIDYGIAGIGAVASFNNVHFCVGPANIYIHDGSTVQQIADKKINDSFYRRLDNIGSVRCTENLDLKEVHTLFDGITGKQYLIYNYKDQTFTYGDALVEGSPVACMEYGLKIPEGGDTYETVATTYATETRRYDETGATQQRRAMFWLTSDGLYEAENLSRADTQKSYFVERGGIDFSEINAALTTNQSKSLHSIVPHINGTAQTTFTLAASQNLRTTAHKIQSLPYDPVTGYKVDPRITGRWLSLRIDLEGDGDWQMSSMDMDIEITDDR